MKCPNCGIEMTEVYSWIEHPGPGGRMIGHPGPLRYYECKQCGNRIEATLKEKVRNSNANL